MQFFFLCISNFLRFALAYLGMCTDLCLRKHKAVWTVDVCWWEIKKEWSRKVVDKFYTFALFLVRFSHLSSVCMVLQTDLNANAVENGAPNQILIAIVLACACVSFLDVFVHFSFAIFHLQLMQSQREIIVAFVSQHFRKMLDSLRGECDECWNSKHVLKMHNDKRFSYNIHVRLFTLRTKMCSKRFHIDVWETLKKCIRKSHACNQKNAHTHARKCIKIRRE